MSACKTPDHNAVATTPNSKTKTEVDRLDLTPKRKQRMAKKLLLTNVLLAEIKKTMESSSRRKRNVIHNKIAGKIAKKYKCMKIISTETGMSRRCLMKCQSKSILVRERGVRTKKLFDFVCHVCCVSC